MYLYQSDLRGIMKLKELSKKLELSETTVSRALNGYSDVSAKTRAKVIDAAERYNYVPSQSAMTLATGKAKAIGHVISNTDHKIINPHFSDFIAGASEIYTQKGYDLVLTSVPQDQEIQAYRRLARSKRVDGFVMQAPLVNDRRLEALTEIGLPFVIHGRTGDMETSDGGSIWLDVDNHSAFHRATSFLLDLGHRDIALLNGVETMTFAKQRRCGFIDALCERGILPREDLLFSEDMLEPYGYRACMELLGRKEGRRPTAILCSSKLIALGVRHAVLSSGLQIGKDVSLVTFDDDLSFWGHGHTIPEITCVRSSISAAGRRVAEMLIGRIENPNMDLASELWQAELLIGKSTGPVVRS
jgi:LacI family transcriptional regulator